jgi:hypothetical protein
MRPFGRWKSLLSPRLTSYLLFLYSPVSVLSFWSKRAHLVSPGIICIRRSAGLRAVRCRIKANSPKSASCGPDPGCSWNQHLPPSEWIITRCTLVGHGILPQSARRAHRNLRQRADHEPAHGSTRRTNGASNGRSRGRVDCAVPIQRSAPEPSQLDLGGNGASSSHGTLSLPRPLGRSVPSREPERNAVSR